MHRAPFVFLSQTEAVICSKDFTSWSPECSCSDSGYSPAFRAALFTVEMGRGGIIGIVGVSEIRR